jgi:hypothetical protein
MWTRWISRRAMREPEVYEKFKASLLTGPLPRLGLARTELYAPEENKSTSLP